MVSKIVGLPKNTCIFGTMEILKQINGKCTLLPNTRPNKSKIIFEKPVKSFWLKSRYRDETFLKGEIHFEGDDDETTKITVRYNRRVFIISYVFILVFISIFSVLPFFLRVNFMSRYPLDLILIFFMYSIILGPTFLMVSIFALVYRHALNEDEKKLANQIYNYITDENIPKIHLSDDNLSNLQKNSSNLQKKLSYQQEFGVEYPVSEQTYKCPVCGHLNLGSSNKCGFCNTIFPRCFICKRSIYEKEIAFCPYCNAPYHKIEFLEWLKTKAHCKVCKREMDLWEFQKYLEQNKQIEQTSSIKCPKCKKLLSKDTNFCMFCGFKIEKPTE